jgi:hypothetical protein
MSLKNVALILEYFTLLFFVCKNIGYTLRSHEYDGTQPGRFNACHAERQMALFAYKYQFGPQMQFSLDNQNSGACSLMENGRARTRNCVGRPEGTQHSWTKQAHSCPF